MSPPPSTLTATHRGEPSSTTTPAAPAQLIDLHEVCRRTGLGRETIRKLIMAGKFPAKIKDPDIRATRWAASQVEAWILDRIARSTGGARR
jgi:transposase/prophage regulatory protein